MKLEKKNILKNKGNFFLPPLTVWCLPCAQLAGEK